MIGWMYYENRNKSALFLWDKQNYTGNSESFPSLIFDGDM